MKELQKIKLEEFDNIEVSQYLTYSQVQAIANAALKFDDWASRNECIDILILHFATNMNDSDIAPEAHDKFLATGLIETVKSCIRNLIDIDRAIQFAESPMRILVQIAKQIPEFNNKVNEVMKNASSKK